MMAIKNRNKRKAPKWFQEEFRGKLERHPDNPYLLEPMFTIVMNLAWSYYLKGKRDRKK